MTVFPRIRRGTCRLRTFLPLSLIALAAAGCGGGGGGGGGGSNPPSTQTFAEEFNSAGLDRGTWSLFGTNRQLQLTQFGLEPTIQEEGGSRFARLRLDTYNPAAPGRLFRGTQMMSNTYFRRGDGLEVTARLRGPNLPSGIVFAFFMINDRYLGAGTPENYRKTEIDYEFLTAETTQFSPAGQRRRLYLNIWDDWNEPRDGYDGNINADSTRQHDDLTYLPSVNGSFNWANWNEYTIRWYPDRTEFWVNGRLERTEREVRPDEDMPIAFNIWSASPDFNRAYTPGFTPTSNASQNETFYFDVDWVRVRSLG